jgi:hypothetical protein
MPGAGLGAGLGARPGLRPVPATAAAAIQQPAVEVVDPDEPRNLQKLRRQLQDMRVALLRVASRLGIRYEAETVQNFLNVLERIERMSKPMSKRRADVNKLAERIATEKERAEAPESRCGPAGLLLLVACCCCWLRWSWGSCWCCWPCTAILLEVPGKALAT